MLPCPYSADAFRVSTSLSRQRLSLDNGRVETMPEQSLFDAVAMRAVEKMDLAIPVAIRRLNRYLVLLTTERSIPAYRAFTPELEWLKTIPLPNTVQMVVAIGRRA